MIDSAIQHFFQMRKEDWLKKKVKSTMNADQIQAIEQACEEKFLIQNWIPDAAKRASQMSISTHPCTFTHPSARKNKNGYVTSVIAKCEFKADGYLRTGNVHAAQDALGNAAVLDVYKFLSLELEDGESVLTHIERDSTQAKQILSIPNEDYDQLKQGFLSMVTNQEQETITSSKLKQVYFPTGDGTYHLLSILSHSGMIYELRKRVDKLRFSEKQQHLRKLKRDNEPSEEGFSDIYDVTTIGYGGTKPQNISVLNNQYGGKARLLMSAPPPLVMRNTQFPRKDFFTQSIRFRDIKGPLLKLQKLFKAKENTDIPRQTLEHARDQQIEAIIEKVIQTMISVRAVAKNQFHESTNALPTYQKIWLMDTKDDQSHKDEAWLDEVCKNICQWIKAAYQKTNSRAMTLGPAEYDYILSYVNKYREALR